MVLVNGSLFRQSGQHLVCRALCEYAAKLENWIFAFLSSPLYRCRPCQEFKNKCVYRHALSGDICLDVAGDGWRDSKRQRHGFNSGEFSIGAIIAYFGVSCLSGGIWRFPNFTLGCRTFATLCAVLEKLRRLMFSLPLHGFALFNHNQETLFCSDYSGLRPIYAAQPHPKTLQPTHV